MMIWDPIPGKFVTLGAFFIADRCKSQTGLRNHIFANNIIYLLYDQFSVGFPGYRFLLRGSEGVWCESLQSDLFEYEGTGLIENGLGSLRLTSFGRKYVKQLYEKNGKLNKVEREFLHVQTRKMEEPLGPLLKYDMGEAIKAAYRLYSSRLSKS